MLIINLDDELAKQAAALSDEELGVVATELAEDPTLARLRWDWQVRQEVRRRKNQRTWEQRKAAYDTWYANLNPWRRFVHLWRVWFMTGDDWLKRRGYFPAEDEQ